MPNEIKPPDCKKDMADSIPVFNSSETPDPERDQSSYFY
jgi:hypothetical protein